MRNGELLEWTGALQPTAGWDHNPDTAATLAALMTIPPDALASAGVPWVPIEEALSLLAYEGARNVVRRAQAVLAGQTGG